MSVIQRRGLTNSFVSDRLKREIDKNIEDVLAEFPPSREPRSADEINIIIAEIQRRNGALRARLNMVLNGCH